MRQPLRLELLETRDLPSGGLGLADLASPDALINWYQAEVRSLVTNIAAISSPAQRWDQVLVGTWYVPSANLLAYLVGPDGNKVPIADETMFQITSAYDGFFSGETQVQFSLPTPSGWIQGPPMQYTLNGLVTPEGQIRLDFTPTDSDHSGTTGVGQMEFVDGSWRMTMQMASNSTPYVSHWAYMTKQTSGATPPTASGPTPVGMSPFAQWNGLLNTVWTLADTELFGSPGVGVFRIEGYDGGYFWGEGMGPTSFSVFGSVTPEGNLFLALTPAGGSTVTRTGSLLLGSGGQWEMPFRSYEGSPALGAAWLLDLASLDSKLRQF
jgi:hypothetical protein